MTNLPVRAPFSTGEAISLSSPSGRMSRRARADAQERLRVALFGKEGLQRPALPPQPSKYERLMAQAANLRSLATRGMRPRAFVRDAVRLECEAIGWASK